MSSDAAPAPAPAPSKSKKIILVAAVLLGGVAVGGGAGAFMAGPLLAGGAAKPAAAAADAGAHGDDAAGDEAADDEAGEDAQGDKAAPGVIHLVENLVLNPANSGGSRFLLLSVGFAVKDEAASKLLQDRDPEVRDVIIRFFGARTVDELVDVTMRDSLKVQLRGAVVERFGGSTVRDVYFPQFVIQ